MCKQHARTDGHPQKQMYEPRAKLME